MRAAQVGRDELCEVDDAEADGVAHERLVCTAIGSVPNWTVLLDCVS